MGIVGIVLALALLMFLAYRGLSLILLSPAMALLAAIIAGGLPPIASYTQIFMTSTGGFIITFFPLFLWAPCSESSWTTADARKASRTGSSASSAPTAQSWRSFCPAQS